MVTCFNSSPKYFLRVYVSWATLLARKPEGGYTVYSPMMFRFNWVLWWHLGSVQMFSVPWCFHLSAHSLGGNLRSLEGERSAL